MHDFNNIKSYLVKMSREGLNYDEVLNSYINNQKNPVLAKDLAAVKAMFEEAILVYPNFNFVQAMLSLQYIKDANTGNYYLVDPVNKKIESIEESVVRTAFSTKAFDRLQAERLYSARLGYNPNENTFLYQEGHIYSINLYRPADWQVPHFTKNVKVPDVKLPLIYDEYLRNLTRNQLSYDYCMAFWAATIQSGFKPQNYCVLIGIPGLGKGVYYQILSELVGANNAAMSMASKLADSNFNGWAKNKKVLFFDELKIRKPEDEDALKPYVGPEIEIEEKGVDKRTYTNYASIMIATNDIGDLKLQEGDRRFCMIDTGSTTLQAMVDEKHPEHDVDSYVNEVLLAPDNIKQLGQYLLNYKYDKKLLTTVLQSETKQTFKEETTADWITAVYTQLCPLNAGKKMSVTEAKIAIRLITDQSKLSPGIRQWTKLSLDRKGFFKVKRESKPDGSTETILVFNSKDTMAKYYKDEV